VKEGDGLAVVASEASGGARVDAVGSCEDEEVVEGGRDERRRAVEGNKEEALPVAVGQVDAEVALQKAGRVVGHEECVRSSYIARRRREDVGVGPEEGRERAEEGGLDLGRRSLVVALHEKPWSARLRVEML
jgi:hypothetical protein